jgi:hypothetical protein
MHLVLLILNIVNKKKKENEIWVVDQYFKG